jgi:hypothetical protein
MAREIFSVAYCTAGELLYALTPRRFSGPDMQMAVAGAPRIEDRRRDAPRCLVILHHYRLAFDFRASNACRSRRKT